MERKKRIDMKMIRQEGESNLTGEGGSIGGFDPWVISLSFCLTLGLVGFILQYLMDINVLELTNFKDRAIGIAVLSGVDTALRTKLYVEFVIGAIVSLFILLVLFDYISNKYLKSIPVSFEKQMIFYTSLFALASMFLYVTSRQILFLNNLKLLGFLTILLSLFILLKLIADRMRWEGITLAFSNSTVISISLIFPFFSYITGLVLLNKSLSFVNDIYHYMILSFLWISFLAIYYMLNIAANKMNRSNVLLSNLVALSFLPILLIPITIPLSNELQFTLSGIVHISPRIISVSIAAFLLLLSLILFIVFSKRDIYVPQSIKVLENAYFPIIIASAILFRNYQHFLVFDVYDMFHQGELLISNQQLFSFGSMPYVGIYPTKGLSEMYYQILYSLVNGYGPVEPLLWSWITPLIGSILLYFIIKSITDPVFSALMILFVPISDVMGGYGSFYYAMSILVALCLIWTLRKTTFLRSSMLWLTIIFIVLWRLDFGVAAFAGAIFILLIIYTKELLMNNCHLTDIRTLSLSLLTIITSITIFYILFVAMNKESVSETLLQNIQFALYQDPVVSYVDIMSGYSNWAVFQYAVLPIISIIYIIYFLIKLFIRKETPSSNEVYLVFLAIFSLVISVRSVQRHSLIEGYNCYLFVFLMIFMPFYFRVKKNISIILLMGLLLTYLLVLPSYTVVLNNQNGEFFDYHDWSGKEIRVIDSKIQYLNIVEFLNAHLGQNQTFFDFTNSPILYVFSNKKHIPYIIPNLYHTSELIQDITLEKLNYYHRKGDLPIVIFKQGNLWDNLDFVPNEIRSYRISEFIYTHYKPFGYLDNFQIWVEDNSTINVIINQSELREQIRLKPEEMCLNDINRISDGGLVFQCGSYDPQISNLLDLESTRNLSECNYPSLIIKYKCSIEGSLQIFYAYNESPFEEIYSFQANIRNTSQNYSELLVPIPNRGRLTDIRFDPPANSVFEIESVEIRKGETGIRTITSKDIKQEFDLKKLPYIWGSYDGKDALKNTEVIEELSGSPMGLDKGQDVVFSFRPITDKSSGNYIHFRIKSEQSANLTIIYGNESISSIMFQVLPSAKYEDYLVRISSQWQWMSEPISSIMINSSRKIEIGGITIKKGD